MRKCPGHPRGRPLNHAVLVMLPAARWDWWVSFAFDFRDDLCNLCTSNNYSIHAGGPYIKGDRQLHPPQAMSARLVVPAKTPIINMKSSLLAALAILGLSLGSVTAQNHGFCRPQLEGGIASSGGARSRLLGRSEGSSCVFGRTLTTAAGGCSNGPRPWLPARRLTARSSSSGIGSSASSIGLDRPACAATVRPPLSCCRRRPREAARRAGPSRSDI